MLLQSLFLLSSPSTLPFFHNPSSSPLFFLQNPTFFSHSSLHLRPLLAQSREPLTTTTTAEEAPEEEKEPIELPQSSSSSPLQTATTVLISGAIAAFLFRSIRRRAKRAKELRLRSSTGTNQSMKEKSLNKLKKMGSASIKRKSSTPFDALLGSLIAGVITVFLYKFTVTTEAALNSQTVSGNFSVRQITITIRTVINGLFYLATFVYGFNSLGLFLYSGQLALSPFMDGSVSKENEKKREENVDSVKQNAAAEGTELTSTKEKEDETRNGKQ